MPGQNLPASILGDIAMSENDPVGGASQTPASPAETGQACQQPHEGRRCPVGGSFVESIAGLAVVVLTIIGLAGTQNAYLIPVVVIIVGAALLMEGCALACRCGRLLHQSKGTCGPPPPVGGANCQLMAGAAGIILGVLALLGVAANELIAVSIIVFGSAITGGSCLKAKLACMECCPCEKCEAVRRVAHESAMAAAGAHALVGLAVVILGILALLGHNPTVLSLVALLVLGSALLMCSIGRGGKMYMAAGHS